MRVGGDRESQRTATFTGIPTVRLQDSAMTTSMGPIFDRTREHLGTTDSAIVQARRLLIAAARALREQATPPPGADHPEIFRVRSCSAVLPADADWQAALEDWHLARTNESAWSRLWRAVGSAVVPKGNKTEHAGAKHGEGAYWGPKDDAKRESKKARRQAEREVERRPEE